MIKRFCTPKALFLLFLVALLTYFACEGFRRRFAFELSGRVQLSTARGTAEIFREKNGIPHIFADSEEMAYYTLGFTEAQDRLFQMDRIRKTVQGRTSELFGEKALDLDILMRSLSIEHAVKREMHKVPVEQRKLLEAYADGVNALVEHAGLPMGMAPRATY